jgi:hypothetical protein
LAAALGRSIGSVQRRAWVLGLLAPRTRPVRLEPESPPLVDDGKFAAAMTTAASAGREHPPGLVPNLRPCTRFPVRLAPGVERAR